MYAGNSVSQSVLLRHDELFRIVPLPISQHVRKVCYHRTKRRRPKLPFPTCPRPVHFLPHVVSRSSYATCHPPNPALDGLSHITHAHVHISRPTLSVPRSSGAPGAQGTRPMLEHRAKQMIEMMYNTGICFRLPSSFWTLLIRQAQTMGINKNCDTEKRTDGNGTSVSCPIPRPPPSLSPRLKLEHDPQQSRVRLSGYNETRLTPTSPGRPPCASPTGPMFCPPLRPWDASERLMLRVQVCMCMHPFVLPSGSVRFGPIMIFFTPFPDSLHKRPACWVA